MSGPAPEPGPAPVARRGAVPAAERGATTVAGRAVRRIAERAATEALGPGDVRVGRGSAAVRGRRARVGVTVSVPYPGVLDDTGARVRAHVVDRTSRLTGLSVDPARIHVRELSVRELPGREPSAQGAPGQGAPGQEEAPVQGEAPVQVDLLQKKSVPARATASLRKASVAEPSSTEMPVSRGDRRRPWSERRVPVAVLVLAAAAVSGVVLYDVVAVHAAGRPPARWRVRLMEWLSTHGPEAGTAMNLVAAAAVSALGLWLLFLAVTPGLRRRLPLTPPLPGVRAVLERGAAAALLRDAVAEVPGVTKVRVRFGRRRARVRGGLEFGDPVTVRQEALRAAQEALTEMGLARPPKLRVRLRREPYWRAPEASSQRPEGLQAPEGRQTPDEPQVPGEAQGPTEAQGPPEPQDPRRTQAPAQPQAPEKAQDPAQPQAPGKAQDPAQPQAPGDPGNPQDPEGPQEHTGRNTPS
ncbi:DUF6286 domain-containing protein [Streptomyces sp. NPDC017941]|uniref:DUF6286 domain-containing Asp23/Gls24 family envelope stress response protein n=1 Tax=Streptomyces sp. NPDC017941 TaxID=3365018 RepID=UPI0037AEED25